LGRVTLFDIAKMQTVAKVCTCSRSRPKFPERYASIWAFPDAK